MIGEKRSSGSASSEEGKLISKTLSKSSSPPSISAPPKAAVGASKAKRDEVQRRKNSFHDIFKSPAKEKDSGQISDLNVSRTDTATPSPSHGSRGIVASRSLKSTIAADISQTTRHEEVPKPESSRIAELETALAFSKKETAALRHELERVKQDAQASVEVSKYQAAEAQRQITSESAIGDLYTHVSSDKVLNDREGELVDENNELRSRLAELEDQLVSQATSGALHSEEDWDTLNLRLHEIEKESSSRLQQLLSLKSSISSLTRADSQASDSELADSFSQLANRVREWVVSNYRRTTMDFDHLPETTVQILRSITANYKGIDPADKLAFYQAIVSRTLMRIFEEPLLVGMADQGVFAGLRTFCEGTQHVGAESGEWRRTTIRLIERSTQASAIRGWKTQALEGLASELEATMRSIVPSTELSATTRSALLGIMSSAADLQQVLCLQKATYSVGFFSACHPKQDRFDEFTMEPVNNLEYALKDSAGLSRQREFIFCVFPCLEKVDESVEKIVFKARVCCGIG